MIKKFLTIGIIILFLGVVINSSVAINTPKNTISNGNTLYVGGTGEGNYTKIQDAVDNASDGDNIFVFDDGSPYYENIEMDKSINLVGENKDTTIIDGFKNGDVIFIGNTDYVNISSFTIVNSSASENNEFQFGAGIRIYKSNYCNILNNNIIKNDHYGLEVRANSYHTLIENNNFINNDWAGIYLRNSEKCIIRNNIVENHWRGISIWVEPQNYTISGNIISNNTYGIYDTSDISINYILNNKILNSNYSALVISSYSLTIITGNEISGGEIGIELDYSNGQYISKNTISNCDLGIYIVGGHLIIIRKNNFINNHRVGFYNSSVIPPFRTIRWSNNYYSRWISFIPKLIYGNLVIGIWSPYHGTNWYVYKWFPLIDWTPSRKPYDIEV